MALQTATKKRKHVPPVRQRRVRRATAELSAVASKQPTLPVQPRPIGQDEAIALRRDKVMSLRVRGAPERAIARAVGVSPATVHEDIVAEMRAAADRTADNSEICRQLALARLDEQMMRISTAQQRQNLSVPDTVALVLAAVKVEHERAGLEGTRAPVKFAPTDPTGTKPYSHLRDEDTMDLLKKQAIKTAQVQREILEQRNRQAGKRLVTLEDKAS